MVVLVDREQGGDQNLSSRGLKLHSVLNMSTVVDTLCQAGKIDDQVKKN